MGELIQLKDVRLNFEGESILADVNFNIKNKEFVSLIGKSGTGKTTILRMVAGLLPSSEGEVMMNGQQVTEPQKDSTYVFQKPVLLEWRTVLENVLLPIELKRKVTEEDRRQASAILKMVDLTGAETKYPHECSGGMLSRASLARALMTSPKLLLMDEPFAALDTMTKRQLQLELTKIADSYRPTVLFVTHDIQEAVFLSNRILVLGQQPAKVVAEVSVPFPRPRKQDLPFELEFLEIVKQVHQILEAEGDES